MRCVEWDVKVSKLCNLRCAYCYEFPDLGDPRRISLENWGAIFESARWYHEELERTQPEPVLTRFIWHGGEPLLLPLAYFQEVLALQRQVLGAERIRRDFENHLPTNLYAVPWDTMDLLRRERFIVSVSFDGLPGARVTAGGQPTEERVTANLRRLLAEGWTLGCNTVLAAHNAARLPEIYTFLRGLSHASPGRLYWDAIPLHGTPTDDGLASFSLPAATLVEAMDRCFAC